MIVRIEVAIKGAPYPHGCHVESGLNHSAFIAHAGRQGSAPKLDLATEAIGKDIARPTGHRGFQHPEAAGKRPRAMAAGSFGAGFRPVEAIFVGVF